MDEAYELAAYALALVERTAAHWPRGQALLDEVRIVLEDLTALLAEMLAQRASEE